MEKLTFKEKSGYAAGDLAANFIWMMVVFFLPNFYADTFAIPATAAGTLFLVVRLFDAINDPLMGIIADRTNTRWGKFRPFLLWFAIPFGLGGLAMFSTPDLDQFGRIVYAYVTYIFMMVIYTALTIPFNALSGVLTLSADERTSLNSFRFVAAYLGGIIIQGLTLPLVAYFGGDNDAKGFQITMGIFSTVAIGLFFVSFFSTKERVQPDKNIEINLRKDLQDLFSNKPWILLFITSLFILVYVSLRSGTILFYFKYYLHNENLASAFMVSGTVAVIIGVILTKPLNKFITRKKLFIGSMVVIALSCIGFYFVNPENIGLIFALQILFSLASGPSMPLLWTMYADTADYSEWKNGRRATGLIFSASTFAMKFGGAVGGAMILWILSFYNYTPEIIQTSFTLNGIKMMMSFYPAIGAVIPIVLLLLYPLDEVKMKEIETTLMKRKNHENDEN
ncbi:MAG: MFS transporter [Bacteroidota bacterium]